MDAATVEHVISQVGRVLDAEVAYRNRQMGQAMTTVAHIRRALLPPNLMNPEPEKSPMSVSGLTQGILQTKLAELRQRGQARLEQGVAKIDAVHSQGLAKVDAAMDDVAKAIDKEIADTIQEFAQTTNGGLE